MFFLYFYPFYKYYILLIRKEFPEFPKMQQQQKTTTPDIQIFRYAQTRLNRYNVNGKLGMPQTLGHRYIKMCLRVQDEKFHHLCSLCSRYEVIQGVCLSTYVYVRVLLNGHGCLNVFF